MKKILPPIFIIILSLLGFAYFNFSPVSPSPSPLPTSPLLPDITQSMNQLVFDHQTYYYAYFLVNDLGKLALYSNYQQQLDTQTLIDQHQCQSLINGGFYDQSDQPLGLFITNHQLTSSQIKSSLLNGFLILDQTPQISTVFTNLNSRIALQSGPLLFLGHQPLPLSIKNDQPRRRSIAFINQNDQLFFLVIISQDSSFSGPLLSDTPQILNSISSQINQPIKSAINLDGGSASSFYTKGLYLKELSFVGSFFCLN